MMSKPKILITGASGFLGSALCRQAAGSWTVTGVRHRRPLTLSGVSSVQADLRHDRQIRDVFDAVNPQAVIHAAAIAQPAQCEQDPYSSAAVNVRSARLLAGLCADRKIPFVFTSTDLVFDGLQPPYDEDHPVTPVSVYGRQKAQAEMAVAERNPDALICRLPLLFGIAANCLNNFTGQLLYAILQGRPMKLFKDEFRTPVDNESAARGLLALLGRSRGLLHLGGRTRLSRYEMGVRMAEYLGVPTFSVQPVTIESHPTGTIRSPDCTLDSRRAYSLGYDPLPLAGAIKQVVDKFRQRCPSL